MTFAFLNSLTFYSKYIVIINAASSFYTYIFQVGLYCFHLSEANSVKCLSELSRRQRLRVIVYFSSYLISKAISAYDGINIIIVRCHVSVILRIRRVLCNSELKMEHGVERIQIYRPINDLILLQLIYFKEMNRINYVLLEA